MKRLTEQDVKGTWRLKGVPWESLKRGAVLSDEVRQKIYSALSKLKDYENTGLSPDQAKQLLNDSWTPVDSEEKPQHEQYVLVSFSNCDLPDIARYEEDEEGGTFYPGDMDESYIQIGLLVNAWKLLPAAYGEE